MSTTTTALVEPAAMSHRRQPVRQARTNPARNAAGGRTLWSGPDAEQPPIDEPPGFFPGLSHFTDSIAALPKEMVRQFTMLKEVDAKIARPEETLKKLTTELLARPLPQRPHPRAYPVDVSTVVGREPESSNPAATEEEYDAQRRELALQLRVVLNNMVPTMDEKTHVLTAATDTLQHLLKRCESSWPQIENEISEVTRLGNPNHRALDTEAAPEKKPSAVGERPRREAAMSNAHAALADERENVRGGSRKNRGQQIDSDFDEPRPTKSKARSRKTELQGNVGLGINGTVPNKRRRVEKTNGSGSQAMERVASSRQGHQVGTASPSQTQHTETTKKRARGNAMAGAVGGRKRQVHSVAPSR
jgi:Inhibitor of growth proteins N-terminal histone-binding